MAAGRHADSPRSIHERSGREKIFSSNVAHGACLCLRAARLPSHAFLAVLNDEVSRKYIQSLKRLMTFAQTKVSARVPLPACRARSDTAAQYPPKDPSMLMG